MSIQTPEAHDQEALILDTVEKFLDRDVAPVAQELEAEDRYLLLVWWDTLEHHTEGFRKSPEYGRWRELLHHFYDPFPEVEHYVAVPGMG